jgi:hypothetical protein
MRRLKRLLGLTASDRWLLLRALLVLGTARVMLWMLPCAMARRVVARTAGITKAIPVERVVWAVKVASRFLPRATCLTQALAVQGLLAGAGYHSRLELGVAKDACRRFEAHAWVICNNHIVIGGPEVARYTRLTAWEM